MKLLDPSELKDILEDSAILGSSIFQNSREFNIFNTILSEAETYDASTFNFPVNAVRVWGMQDGKKVSSLEDIIDYMKFNKIPSIKQAVDDVCHENHIDKLALYISLEGIMEAKSRAAKASKTHKAVAICKGCGNPVTECTCSKSESADTAEICKSCQKPINECTCKKTESSNPDIAMFNNIMTMVENCINNDIEIVFKSENINESIELMAASMGVTLAKSALLKKARKIVKELQDTMSYAKYEYFNKKFKMDKISHEAFNFATFPTIIGTMTVDKIDVKDGKEYISKLTSDITRKYKGIINKAQWASHTIGDKTYFVIGLTDKISSKAIGIGKTVAHNVDKANFKINKG